VTGAPALAAAALALALCGCADERRLDLMEGEAFLQDTVVTSIKEFDQRRFHPHALLLCKIDRMTGVAQ
jgi:hypothetical protein